MDDLWQLQMVRDIQKASRNLCHRQLSWFRDEALFRWVDAARDPEQVADDIMQMLGEDCHEGRSAMIVVC